MSSAAVISSVATSSFKVGAALDHGFARVRQAPGRAAWLFGWDGATALLLILIGAHFVMTADMDRPDGFAGMLFMLAVFARRVASDAAWMRFFLGEPEAKPYVPFRFGADEWRLLGAGLIAGTVLVLAIALIVVPVMFVVATVEPLTVLAWMPVLMIFAGLFLVFPRYLITLACTVLHKRIAPFDDLAATGQIWGRAVLAGIVISIALLLAFIAAGALFQIAGIAVNYESFGAQIDVLYRWSLTAPLSGIDALVLAVTALGASLFWVMARGAAAYAALALVQMQEPSPPSVSGLSGAPHRVRERV